MRRLLPKMLITMLKYQGFFFLATSMDLATKPAFEIILRCGLSLKPNGMRVPRWFRLFHSERSLIMTTTESSFLDCLRNRRAIAEIRRQEQTVTA